MSYHLDPRITELTKKDYRKETPRVAFESVKNFDRLGVKTPVDSSENGMVKLDPNYSIQAELRKKIVQNFSSVMQEINK